MTGGILEKGERGKEERRKGGGRNVYLHYLE
jgi:hypothetical protein